MTARDIGHFGGIVPEVIQLNLCPARKFGVAVAVLPAPTARQLHVAHKTERRRVFKPPVVVANEFPAAVRNAPDWIGDGRKVGALRCADGVRIFTDGWCLAVAEQGQHALPIHIPSRGSRPTRKVDECGQHIHKAQERVKPGNALRREFHAHKLDIERHVEPEVVARKFAEPHWLAAMIRGENRDGRFGRREDLWMCVCVCVWKICHE